MIQSGNPIMVSGPGGVNVAAYEWGNPSGRELLLIHGMAQCHLCWSPQIGSELAREFRIVAFDMRGHGASDKPSDPKAYQGESVWADEILAVMDAKRLRRPVIAGWSMGGRVTRQYLMRHGDARLAGINFVSSRPIEVPGSSGPRTRPDNRGVAKPLGTLLEEAIAFLDGCYEIKPAEADFRLALAYNMLVPLPVRDAISGWITDPEETRAAFAKVRVPTLVTHGEKDAITLPLAAEMTAAAIQGATLSLYPGCGHSPFQEDAARFNRELAAFVRAT